MCVCVLCKKITYTRIHTNKRYFLDSSLHLPKCFCGTIGFTTISLLANKWAKNKERIDWVVEVKWTGHRLTLFLSCWKIDNVLKKSMKLSLFRMKLNIKFHFFGIFYSKCIWSIGNLFQFPQLESQEKDHRK